MTKRAVYDIETFKSLGDPETGRFEAIVSVFGNVDFQGDRVVEGAFTNSIDEWKASGSPIPVIWSHQWGNPDAHIGSVDPSDIEEIPGKGLKVVGDLDTEEPFARRVYKLLKSRRVKEFSFAYDVVRETKAEDGANELLELRIIEVGPTLRGANPDTELLGVKAELEEAATKISPDAGEKAGRVLSKANESLLRVAMDNIAIVLDGLGADDDDPKATDDVEAKEVHSDNLELFARIEKMKGA